MKKALFILMAALMVVGATQCKKQPEKYGPFVLNASLPGSDGKAIDPFGHVSWGVGDKIYAFNANGEFLATLVWAAGNKFYSDDFVENEIVNFFYLGTNTNYDANNFTGGFAHVSFDGCLGTIEDLSKCHVMSAQGMVTNGQANVTMQNRMAIAYVDISGFSTSTTSPSVKVYGSNIYRGMKLDLSNPNLYEGDTLTSVGPEALTVPSGWVYLPLVPTDRATLSFEFGGNVKNLTTDDGNAYIQVRAGDFYSQATGQQTTPIRVYSGLPETVTLNCAGGNSFVYTIAGAPDNTSSQYKRGVEIADNSSFVNATAVTRNVNAHLGTIAQNFDNTHPTGTFYVRAYVQNGASDNYARRYSEPKAFKFPKEGALNGIFSVSDTKKVRFSQGNLIYNGGVTTPWRFHTGQLIYYATDHVMGHQLNPTEDSFFDLFNYGTSGQNENNKPWNINYEFHIFDWSNWGTNAISNGGNSTGLWYTMPEEEWKYLLGIGDSESRPDASSKRGRVNITFNSGSTLQGLVILPDEWVLPEGCTFSSTNINTYTDDQWTLMEECGAVLLLSNIGHRKVENGTAIGYSNPTYYWINFDANISYALSLTNTGGYDIAHLPLADHYGCRVRLVQRY